MAYKYEADDVRDEARGKWDRILRTLVGQELEQALKKPGKHVGCPVHGGTDGFRLFPNYNETGGGVCNTCGTFNNGISLYMWLTQTRFPQALEDIADVLGMSAGDDVRPQRTRPTASPPAPTGNTEAENERLRQKLQEVWMATLSLTAKEAEPARLYFARRGLRHTIGLPEQVVRFHPSLPYYDKDENDKTICLGHFPTIVSLVQGADGKPVTLHRTYLDAEGFKAEVPSPKKMMAYPDTRQLLGGAIRLCPPARVMGTAEGLETSLAIIQSNNMPVWPGVNATMMENMILPPEVEVLYVFADKDRSNRGVEAAKKLRERMWKAGKQAGAFLPPIEIPEGAKGVDWLDLFNRYGPRAIPAPAKLQEILSQQPGPLTGKEAGNGRG